MASGATSLSSLPELLGAEAPSTAPLDAAVEYLRLRVGWALPLYVLAMLPHALVIRSLITAVVAEERNQLPFLCALLAAATVWRWIWLAWLQAMVQADLGVVSNPGAGFFFRRLLPILNIRLMSFVAISWGAMAVVPAFYGFLIGSFATPLLLENSDSSLDNLRKVFSWIHSSMRRLIRMSISLTALACLLLVAFFASQFILAGTVLPSLLGIDTVELNVTLDSWSWRFSALYFLWLLLDWFWTVASVIVFYDSQSRRMATDLRSRLRSIGEEQA